AQATNAESLPVRPARAGQAPRPDPWLHEFAAARHKAAAEGKDILISFEGSDWNLFSARMQREVFAQPAFLDRADRDFVLLKVDFPRDPRARARLTDPAAHDALQNHS